MPGTVLKIMIDGRPSINIHGMPGLDGQGDDKNVFDRSSSNILQPPKNPILKVRLLAGVYLFAPAILPQDLLQFLTSPFHCMIQVLMAAFNIGVKTLASNPADRYETPKPCCLLLLIRASFHNERP